MKINEEKFHLLISGLEHEFLWGNIGWSKIWEGEKQITIVIDWNLRFNEYILSQCKKAGRILSVFVRICKVMAIERRRILMKAFIEFMFCYFSFVWMCCNRSCNNRINHLHEGALRIVYNDSVSSFEDLLQRDQSANIHHRNISLSGIELYRTRNNISVDIMKNTLQSSIINRFYNRTNKHC